MARRLAAILAADVVGYSRLMGADETGTLDRLKSLRKDLVQPQITGRGGRIVKLMGDGLLAEFPSVVEAVLCAVDIQEAMMDRERNLPEEDRIKLRIGVNLGDVIVEGSDIYGDGVNLAARLEASANPGGICLSGSVFDHVRGKVDLEFANLGTRRFKNIDRPVQVHRIVIASEAEAAASANNMERDAAALELPDNPSVAVLPFTNMSGDPDQQYFSDGITEDIITELSRFGAIEVVARNSTFVFRDQAVDVSEAGKVLGARYLLEGSLRKAGNRIRLTAQLIDVETGRHIWADRYDRELEDVFAIQDELVHAIVATLAGRVETADTERSLRKPPENLAAYDYYLRALQLDRKYDAASALEGRKALEKAVALDPTFARAHALLSNFTFYSGWFDRDDHASDDKALSIARRAIELDPDDSDCYAKMAVVHLQRGEFEQAQHYFERALALNPHDSTTWSHHAWYLVCAGEPQRALDQLSEREAVEPFPPNWHWEIRGQALYLLGRYEEAASTFERMTHLNYWDHGFLCACYGQLGQIDKARGYWSKVLEVVPDATADILVDTEFRKHKADSDHWLDGCRKAGVI